MKKNTKGERTRAAIIAAAHGLFITQGYNATSMRQIAQAAGIAPGGIYNHFSGKEAIFEAVFLENHPYREMLPALENAQGDTVEDFVRSAAGLLLDFIRQKPGFLNLWFIEIVEFNSAHALEVLNESMPRGLRIVQNLQSFDQQLRSIPPQMLIRAFISLFFSYFLTESMFGKAAPAEFTADAMEYHIEIFLHGILKQKK